MSSTIRPTGNNVLIKLPDYQQTRERQLESGIIIKHLKGKTDHDASNGIVVSAGDRCKYCKAGDLVFFDKYTIMQGLQNSGRDESQADALKGQGSLVPIYYIENTHVDDVPELEKGLYVVMPEPRIFTTGTDISGTFEIPLHQGVVCLVRDEKVIMCNNYFLLQKAYNDEHIQKQGLVYSVRLTEEQEKRKRFEVIEAPEDSDIKKGDFVATMEHCDLNIESIFNFPYFPKDTYFIHRSNILAKVSEPQALAC